jgi:hypothetical protein
MRLMNFCEGKETMIDPVIGMAGEEHSRYELIWQLERKYSYLASLYPLGSAERKIYQSMSNGLARECRVEAAASSLQYWINAAKQRITDERWLPEYRQFWQKEVECGEQVLEAIRRFDETIELLEHVQQQIKEQLQ